MGSKYDVPVIDLRSDDAAVEIARACSTFGFFQVIHHGIDLELIAAFRSQCDAYFTKLDDEIKNQQRRHQGNSRGYFDDELTKQKVDWKQALDVGVPGSRDWTVLPDDDAANHCLDGWNQLPTNEQLEGFRDTVVRYFEACADLSHHLAILMASGLLGTKVDGETTETGGASSIVQDLRRHHTSYLRMNYYPTCPENHKDDPLGISPHKDAGFLTVLLQDDDCHSLQVLMEDNNWHTVGPVHGSLTINTGDMAQIWSNGKYKAPLHRVLTNSDKTRHSAPFFYNPGYESYIQPAVSINDDSGAVVKKYHPVLWGYFRAVRFAGDLTDLGVEIQIDDFETSADNKDHEKGTSNGSKHLEKQAVFAEKARFDAPFSVEDFRAFL